MEYNLTATDVCIVKTLCRAIFEHDIKDSLNILAVHRKVHDPLEEILMINRSLQLKGQSEASNDGGQIE